METEIIVAIIAGCATVLAAVIGGVFAIITKKTNSKPEQKIQVNGNIIQPCGVYALTKEPYTFRQLTTEEIPAALSLAWEVFSENESPVYSEEGTEEFRKCLHDEKYLAGNSYYGTFDGKTLIGQIGIRPEQRHICFFFVKGSYHRRGIGTRLFRQLLRDVPNGTITLNASPYGLPFYEALGFLPTGKEQTVNGIRFTPMEYHVNAKGRALK